MTPLAVARLAAKLKKGDNTAGIQNAAGILVNRIRGGEGERVTARQTKPLIDEDLELAEEVGVDAAVAELNLQAEDELRPKW